MAAWPPVQLRLKLLLTHAVVASRNWEHGFCSRSSTRELGVSGLQDGEIRDDQELPGGRLPEAAAAGSGSLRDRVRTAPGQAAEPGVGVLLAEG